jgi:hypothetical protein
MTLVASPRYHGRLARGRGIPLLCAGEYCSVPTRVNGKSENMGETPVIRIPSPPNVSRTCIKEVATGFSDHSPSCSIALSEELCLTS